MHTWQHFSLWTFFAYRYNWLYIILFGGLFADWKFRD